MEYLEYHGHLQAIVDARRIGWPLVKSADRGSWAVVLRRGWGEHEIYDYLDARSPPDRPIPPCSIASISMSIRPARDI